MWTYDEALDYLYSFINYEVKREVRYAPEVMNLDRPRALLAALGNPQLDFPVIHITGTKGKGSVGAYCQGALQAAGLKTALYSSPHLQDFRERFRVNNDIISPEMLATLVERMKPAVDAIEGLTWFELTTALAFLYFQQEAVDIVVLEVGLGGRLDATNVVTPVVSVITSLSYDHTHLLGNTLAEIAYEKAGIIKPGVPVVSAPQDAEAARVIAEVSAANGSPLFKVGEDWLVVPGAGSAAGQEFKAGKGDELREYWTPLIGGHQAINATVALAALDVIQQTGLVPPGTLVPDGRMAANWPGRFEIVQNEPVMVLDAAHNGASAAWLRDTLAQVFSQASPRVLVFGASADKDVMGMFAELLPAFDHIVLTQANHPRAMAISELQAFAEQVADRGEVHGADHVRGALEQARLLAGENGLITVTGSLFIVGEVRDLLGLPLGRAVYLKRAVDLS